MNVNTIIGKTFLKLVDRELPLHHKLSELFKNNNTLKISYGCCIYIKIIINAPYRRMRNSDPNKLEQKYRTCNR